MTTTANPYLLRRRLDAGRGAPTAVDLFSGAGGLTLGLINSGFNVLLAADLDEGCARTHERNFNVPFLRGDVSKLSGQDIQRATGLAKGELDLLIGGPPCQGFSILGQREIEDPRNSLFHEFLRVAKEMRPKCVVIENVPGLATLGGGSLLERIGADFARAGYNVECAELLAAQYGVPQMRWRMFFVGWRKDLLLRGGFPLPTHGRSGIGDLLPNRTITAAECEGFIKIRDAIGDLPRIRAGDSSSSYARDPVTQYQKAMRSQATGILHNHYAAKLSEQNLARLRSLKPGQDWRDLPVDLLPQGMKRALRKDHTRRFRRMKWDGVARSIITRFRDPKSGEYTHPDQHRTISIREAARIQSFPDWFVFEGNLSQQYDQVGNAVPPLLARAVASELKNVLIGASKDDLVSIKSRYRISGQYGFSRSMALEL